MKKLIAVAILATSTVSFAADRAIYDVQYLPNAGTTYGQTDWSWTKAEVEADAGDSKTDGWDLTQVIGHSFTDRLSVQASMNYTDMTTDPDTAGQKDTDTTGISDPTLTARYRIMDEAWRLDILGGATIGLGDNKIKSNGDDNNYQGGSDLFLGAQIGQRWDKMQWAVLAQYTQNMEATTDNATGGDTKADTHGDWTLRADLLNQFSEKSFLRSHLTGQWTPEVDSKTSGVKSTSASSAQWELGTQYQHLCSVDLLAFGGIDYQMNNTQSGQIDTNKAWVLTLGARYQF